MEDLETYRITIASGRSTEELVAAAGYGYAHSAIISENFPLHSPSRHGWRRGTAMMLY